MMQLKLQVNDIERYTAYVNQKQEETIIYHVELQLYPR